LANADHPQRDLSGHRAAQTTRVSVATGGAASSVESNRPWISGDGRYVAFSSSASDPVPGDGNSTNDVFLRDVQAGTTTRVSVATGGGDPNGSSDLPSLSGDGRYAAFHSLASNLVSGDSNSTEDVFVHDRVRGRDHPVQPGSVPRTGERAKLPPKNQRYVAFLSGATNLVSDDANAVPDVYIKYARVLTVSGISPQQRRQRPNEEGRDHRHRLRTRQHP
jgi:Tol biopolymer transport system component